MTNNYFSEKIKNIYTFSEDFYYANYKPFLKFHSWFHTQYVYSKANYFANQYQLSEYDNFCLLSAAILHDIGIVVSYENHEEESANIADGLLRKIDMNNEDIEKICDIILSTRENEPKDDLLKSILYDCNYDYLSKPDFIILSFWLRDEWNQQYYYKFTTEESWLLYQLNFLRNFEYLTIADCSRQIRGLAHNLAYVSNLVSRNSSKNNIK